MISPDGKRIACTYRKDEADKWTIAVLAADGGEPLAVFGLPYLDDQVIRRSPDGEALDYLDRCNGVFNVWRQNLDGSTPTQLTNFTEDGIFAFDWDDAEQLIAARGAKIRDIMLIRNFE